MTGLENAMADPNMLLITPPSLAQELPFEFGPAMHAATGYLFTLGGEIQTLVNIANGARAAEPAQREDLYHRLESQIELLEGYHRLLEGLGSRVPDGEDPELLVEGLKPTFDMINGAIAYARNAMSGETLHSRIIRTYPIGTMQQAVDAMRQYGDFAFPLGFVEGE